MPENAEALFCVGHSHLRAVTDGAREAGLPIAAFSLHSPASEADRAQKRDLWEVLSTAIAADRPSRLLCFVGGSVHAALGLLLHEIPFDFILPARPDLPLERKARIIPYTAVRQMIEQRMQHHLKVLGRLRRLGLPVSQFECPPPIFDNALLHERLPHFLKAVDPEALERGGYQVASPWLRYKLWLVQSQVFREFARARRIVYVRNPATVVDRRGFLLADCLHDTFHGNGRYGARILSSWLAKPQASTARRGESATTA